MSDKQIETIFLCFRDIWNFLLYCTICVYSTCLFHCFSWTGCETWHKDCRPQINVVPVNTVHCVLIKTVFVVGVPTTRVTKSVSKGWLIINIKF